MNRKLLLFLCIGIFQQSCSIISFTESPEREPIRQSIQLSPDFKLSSTGAVYMNLAGIIKADFLPAGIRMEYKKNIIFIDPIVTDDTTTADLIFITHVHADHFSLADIEKLTKKETLIIGPKPVVKKLSEYPVKEVRVGDKLDLGNIRCEVVESYNLKKGFFNFPVHKKSDNNVGYIISCDSIRIYHAGDTDFIPEMKGFENITIALVPVGEGKTAMTPEQAAEAVNIIKPEIAVPVHYKIGMNRAELFKNLVNDRIKVEILQ